jgi:chromosomal replication initiator protein
MNKIKSELEALQAKSLALKHELELLDIIRNEVADYFRLKPDSLNKRTRLRTYLWPRQIAIYFTREYTSFGYADIAKLFGLKNHATAIHSVKVVASDVRYDRRKENQVNLIKLNILNHGNINEEGDQEGRS